MYPSVYYLWSAEHHARLAGEIEHQHSGPNKTSVRHWAYVISAVTDAVALMESVVNEVIQDVVDSVSAGGPDTHIQSLDQTVRERLIGYWISGEKFSILDKYNHSLKLATSPDLSLGQNPLSQPGRS